MDEPDSSCLVGKGAAEQCHTSDGVPSLRQEVLIFDAHVSDE